MSNGRPLVATGADDRYGYHLLNLLGSLKANAGPLGRVVAFDLGLTGHQRRLLDHVEGVEVGAVPAFDAHWAEGRTWKTWIWTHLDADEVLWLDAGLTVLRPLDDVFAAIRRDGYFAVSQGLPNRVGTPSDYVRLYGLTDEQLDRDQIAAGIFGFRTSGPFYDAVVVPTHEDCLQGRSRGYSPGEERLNTGLDRAGEVIVRDCPHFRWDQSVLNVHFARAVSEPVVHDLDRFAGWRSPRDHPEQVIWSHRRRGSMAYLARVPYARGARLRGRLFGIVFRVRWWKKLHAKYFDASTYVWKLRKIARGAR